jgi:hypothetical protein
MRIELLHIDDCPNTAEALDRVETALTALGRRDLTVRLRNIKSPADIAGTAFSGSPTITVNGADIFPGASPPLNWHAGSTPHQTA